MRYVATLLTVTARVSPEVRGLRPHTYAALAACSTIELDTSASNAADSVEWSVCTAKHPLGLIRIKPHAITLGQPRGSQSPFRFLAPDHSTQSGIGEPFSVFVFRSFVQWADDDRLRLELNFLRALEHGFFVPPSCVLTWLRWVVSDFSTNAFTYFVTHISS